MYRILKKSGAERVSDESADELRRIIEDIADNPNSEDFMFFLFLFWEKT